MNIYFIYTLEYVAQIVLCTYQTIKCFHFLVVAERSSFRNFWFKVWAGGFFQNFLDFVLALGYRSLMRHWIDHTEQHWCFQCLENQLTAIVWNHHRLSVTVCTYLETRDFHVLCCTCVSYYVDHSAIALSITSRRINYSRQEDWEVPTPRVATTLTTSQRVEDGRVWNA